MDPLSIAAGSASLAKLCISLSVKITTFVSDARTIDDNVRALNQGLSALSEVLISVSIAWTSNPEISAARSGPDRALWVSVKNSIARCTTVLEKFQVLLNKVTPDDAPSRNMFKRSVAKIRLDLNMGDIEAFRAEVDVYSNVLTIALNSITTCAIIRRDRNDGVVFSRLHHIEQGIESLAKKFNSDTSSSITLDPDTKSSLNSFIKAAKDFQSSASEYSSSGSTIMGGNATERGGSVFGEPLSKERVTHIEGWIPAPLNEIIEGPISNIASSTGWNGPLQDVETLPELMSVLENVAQMADRFQAVEKQKNFTKDEEIRSLQQQVERLLESRDDAMKHNRELQRECKSLIGKLNAIETTLSQKDAAHQQTTGETERLRSQLEMLTTTHQELFVEARRVLADNEKMKLETRELVDTRRELENMKMVLHVRKVHADDLQSQLQANETELKDVQIELTKQKRETDFAKDRIHALEAMIHNASELKQKFIDDITKQATDYAYQFERLIPRKASTQENEIPPREESLGHQGRMEKNPIRLPKMEVDVKLAPIQMHTKDSPAPQKPPMLNSAPVEQFKQQGQKETLNSNTDRRYPPLSYKREKFGRKELLVMPELQQQTSPLPPKDDFTVMKQQPSNSSLRNDSDAGQQRETDGYVYQRIWEAEINKRRQQERLSLQQ